METNKNANKTTLFEGKIELLPCPFCGREAQLAASDHGVSVKCKRCGASTIVANDGKPETLVYANSAVESVVEAWNLRTAPW